MAAATITTYGAFDSGAVAVGTDWTEIVRLRSLQGDRKALIHFTVGSGAALTAFKLTQAVTEGGAEKDVASDAGFNTATDKIPLVLGTNVHTTAASGTFQVRVNFDGATDLVFYAKRSSATTLRAQGRVF